MSVVEPSDVRSPSSHSVDYLFGTNPQEEGEVITSGVRENPVTIDSEGPDLVDYETSEEYPNFFQDDSGMQTSPDGNQNDGDAGRTDGSLTNRGSSPPRNTEESLTVRPSQTSQTVPEPSAEPSLRDQVASLTTSQQQLIQQLAFITQGLGRAPILGEKIGKRSGSGRGKKRLSPESESSEERSASSSSEEEDESDLEERGAKGTGPASRIPDKDREELGLEIRGTKGAEPVSNPLTEERSEGSLPEKRQSKRPRQAIVLDRAPTPPSVKKGKPFKVPAEKGRKGGKGKGKVQDGNKEKQSTGTGTAKDTAGPSRGTTNSSGAGTSKDTAGPSRGSTRDSAKDGQETEVTDLTQTEDSPSEKCDTPQGKISIVFDPSCEVAHGEKYPGEHFISPEDQRATLQTLDTVERLYQTPIPSDGFQKFPQVAAALNDYRVSLHATIRYNNHSASQKTAVEYLAKVRVNASRGELVNITKHSPLPWECTCAIEACSAWLSQINVQLGLLTLALDHKAAGKYSLAAENHKQVLERLHKRLLLIIKRYCSGNGKRQFVNFGELKAVVNALTVGEQLLHDL